MSQSIDRSSGLLEGSDTRVGKCRIRARTEGRMTSMPRMTPWPSAETVVSRDRSQRRHLSDVERQWRHTES